MMLSSLKQLKVWSLSLLCPDCTKRLATASKNESCLLRDSIDGPVEAGTNSLIEVWSSQFKGQRWCNWPISFPYFYKSMWSLNVPVANPLNSGEFQNKQSSNDMRVTWSSKKALRQRSIQCGANSVFLCSAATLACWCVVQNTSWKNGDVSWSLLIARPVISRTSRDLSDHEIPS